MAATAIVEYRRKAARARGGKREVVPVRPPAAARTAHPLQRQARPIPRPSVRAPTHHVPPPALHGAAPGCIAMFHTSRTLSSGRSSGAWSTMVTLPLMHSAQPTQPNTLSFSFSTASASSALRGRRGAKVARAGFASAHVATVRRPRHVAAGPGARPGAGGRNAPPHSAECAPRRPHTPGPWVPART